MPALDEKLTKLLSKHQASKLVTLLLNDKSIILNSEFSYLIVLFLEENLLKKFFKG